MNYIYITVYRFNKIHYKNVLDFEPKPHPRAQVQNIWNLRGLSSQAYECFMTIDYWDKGIWFF